MRNRAVRYRWGVVGLLWAVCFFSYADRQALFSVFPLLQKEMQLSTVQLGLLGSSFAVVYGIGGPFAGFVIDKIRRKSAILGGLQLWSVICICSALSKNFAQLLIFRAGEGIGETIFYPGALSMLSDHHGKRSRSRAMGLLQTSVYAGTIGGGYWAGALAQHYGWRMAIMLFGGLGSLLGLVLIPLLREPVRGSAEEASRPAATAIASGQAFSFAGLRSLLVNKSLLTLMAVFVCANFVAMVLLTWMPTYLYARFHLSLGTAAFDAAVYPQLASMAGSVCGGVFADLLSRRTQRGRVLVQCLAVMGGAPFVALCGLAGSLTLVKVALICWGAFKGVYDSNIFASAFDVVPASRRGLVSGSMNCVGWLLGAGTAPVLIGYLAVRYPLGHAIAMCGGVYLLAAALLVLLLWRFLLPDIARLRHPVA